MRKSRINLKPWFGCSYTHYEYADMFVEAETVTDAEAIAERITGMRVWGSHEFEESHTGEIFTEDFVNFLDSKTGVWH